MSHEPFEYGLVPMGESGLTVENPQADVRGRKVLDEAGEEIGHVDDLLIDERDRRVRLLRVAAGGFLGLGERHFLVPVDAIAAVGEDEVRLGHRRDRVVASPAYDPKLCKQPDYLTDLYSYWGYGPYWGAGYVYPPFPY
ncbi:MAG TPA: PRC-barrel domain-containing protein [Deinococcales bacterium]|nr:PRC-barrel domain-containing protein [Deinococcales bacterium]